MAKPVLRFQDVDQSWFGVTGTNPYSGVTFRDLLQGLSTLQQENPDATFDDLLKLVSMRSGITGEFIDGSMGTDFLQSLFNTQLSRFMTSEQNAYNSPAAQLERLMQTGMSRDAAMQMLSGNVQEQASPIGVSPAASQSSLTDKERTAATVNSALSIASIACGLSSCGVGSAVSILQARNLANSAHFSDVQNEAYDLVGACAGIADEAGLEINSDNFGNATKILSTIQGLANSGNSAAQSFLDNGGAKKLSSNYFVPFAASQAHQARRAASDYDDYFDQNLSLLNAEERVKNANEQNLLQEYQNLSETFNNIVASTKYVEQLTKVAESNIPLLENEAKECLSRAEYYRQLGQTEKAKRLEIQANIKLKNAQTYKTMVEAKSQNLEFQRLSNLYTGQTAGMSNMDVINGAYMSNMLRQLRTMQKLSSPEQVNAFCDKVFQEATAASQIALLHQWIASGKVEEFNKYPETYRLAMALQESGLFDYYESLTVVKSETFESPFVKTQTDIRSNPALQGILQPDDTPPSFGEFLLSPRETYLEHKSKTRYNGPFRPKK